MQKFIKIIIAACLLTGCGKLHPHCVDIQQGNIVDKNLEAKLHLGMDKSEVNSILGTPVLQDMFNKNIWTYVYTNQINCGKIEEKKLILEFRNNKLIGIN